MEGAEAELHSTTDALAFATATTSYFQSSSQHVSAPKQPLLLLEYLRRPSLPHIVLFVTSDPPQHTRSHSIVKQVKWLALLSCFAVWTVSLYLINLRPLLLFCLYISLTADADSLALCKAKARIEAVSNH